MSDYGQQVIGVVGTSLQLVATDFHDTIWKIGGVSVAWATVTAVGSDTTLPGGTVVKAGKKYIPMGTPLVLITSGGNAGKYGPANTTATDGRQTVDATRRSEVFLLNEDLTEEAAFGLVQGNASDHPGVVEAGTVWKSRLHVGGVNEVTLANLYLAMPGLRVTTM